MDQCFKLTRLGALVYFRTRRTMEFNADLARKASIKLKSSQKRQTSIKQRLPRVNKRHKNGLYIYLGSWGKKGLEEDNEREECTSITKLSAIFN